MAGYKFDRFVLGMGFDLRTKYADVLGGAQIGFGGRHVRTERAATTTYDGTDNFFQWRAAPGVRLWAHRHVAFCFAIGVEGFHRWRDPQATGADVNDVTMFASIGGFAVF